MWGAVIDERTSLLFTVAAGPHQRSHSRISVRWDSQSYFNISDSRLPFSSPRLSVLGGIRPRLHTGVTDRLSELRSELFYNSGRTELETTTSNRSSVITCFIRYYKTYQFRENDIFLQMYPLPRIRAF
jgi:hypothetical protein